MTDKQAKDILAENCLDLSYSGHDSLPCKMVEIDRFTVKDEKPGEHFCEEAVLLGLMKKKTKKNPQYEGNYNTWSFLVMHGSDYYYREFLGQCIDVVRAIKHLNRHEGGWPDTEGDPYWK